MRLEVLIYGSIFDAGREKSQQKRLRRKIAEQELYVLCSTYKRMVLPQELTFRRHVHQDIQRSLHLFPLYISNFLKECVVA